MKKKFNRKKTLFSVICGFVLSLICGFGFLDVKEAKALDSSIDIYDYEWANFFDLDSCDFGSNTSYILSKAEDSSVSDYPFIRLRTNSNPLNAINLDYYPFGENGCLSSVTRDGSYCFTFRYYTSFNSMPELRLNFETYSGYVSLSHNSVFVLPFDEEIVSLSIGRADGAAIPANSVIEYLEIGCYYGEYSYDYTPYFYSLERLPGGSGDSGSGDSGSDTPDVPDLPDDPDTPEVDGNYQEGYLAGLAQARYGFFANATYKLVLDVNYQDEDEIYTVEPTLIYGGFDFTSVYDNWHQNYPDSLLNSAHLEILFPEPVPISLFNFTAYGSDSLFIVDSYLTGWSTFFKNVDIKSCIAWRKTEGGFFRTVFDYTHSEVVDKLVSFNIDSMSFLNGFKLQMTDLGYSSGFLAGQKNSDDFIYDLGYDTGYASGFQTGKNEGYASGFIAGSSNDPYGLADFMYTTLDMPGRILSNFLNFEFLGVNLMGLFSFLLSAVLLFFIFKKVV